MNKPYVARTYEVVLMPDAATTYDPTTVVITFKAEDAARWPATSSRMTTAAYRRAVEIEHETNDTPPDRRLLCGSVELVDERAIDRDELMALP